MVELLGTKAEVFDIDDTLIFRQPLIRYLGALATRIPPLRTSNCKRPAKIPCFSRKRIEEPKSRMERIVLAAHIERRAIPEMRDLLIQSYQAGSHIYLLTGRSTNAEWVDGTTRQLAKEDILPYVTEPASRLHTPGGKDTTLSKIYGLDRISHYYEMTCFSDDHWPTIHQGIRLLPNVGFRYVYHGFPCIYPSEREFAEYPNLSVVDLTKSAKKQVLFFR